MMTRAPHRVVLVALLLTLVGCTGHGRSTLGAAPVAKAGTKAPAASHTTLRRDPYANQKLNAGAGRLVALPGPIAAFIAVTDPTDLAGTVEFLNVDEPFFADSAAAYRLLAIGAAAHTLVTLTTLEDEIYTQGAKSVFTTSDASGAFSLGGRAPGDRPFVVSAGFARGHRMTAIVADPTLPLAVDEATSMVTEMARWQLASDADPDRLDLTDVAVGTLDTLHARTRELLATLTLPVTTGTAPSVESLRTGAGFVLRNLYVEAFGSAVTAAGNSLADTLSDAWTEVLGYRPLALTRVAGNGVRGTDQSDGRIATDTPIPGPIDAVADVHGNVYFAMSDVSQIGLVPKTSFAGPLMGEDDLTLTAGNVYTVAGVVNGVGDPFVWEENYRDASATDVTNPEVPAPPLAGGYGIYTPEKLVVETAATVTTASHLYYTSGFTGHVMLLPVEAVSHFGHAYHPRRLYSVAGVGPRNSDGEQVDGSPWVPAADGMAADTAGLYFPTGACRDGAGNLWILDAGDGTADTGRLLLVRESDGQIFHLPLTRGGDPFSPDGALDVRLSPLGDRLFIADTERHWVFSLPTPDAGTLASWSGAVHPAAAAITRVVGKMGVAGFLDTSLPGVTPPDVLRLNEGIPDPAGDADPATVTALLDRPGSIAFDTDGNLLIGDSGNGRIRLRQADTLYTIAGGLDTAYITGDARLAFLPSLGYLNLDAEGNVLVPDRIEAVVRRLHTARGSLRAPI